MAGSWIARGDRYESASRQRRTWDLAAAFRGMIDWWECFNEPNHFDIEHYAEILRIVYKGLKKGDVLGVLSWNSIEYAEVFGDSEKGGFITITLGLI